MNSDRLLQVRKARKLSQADLAKKSGVVQPKVSQAESGFDRLTPDEVQRIADALGVPKSVLEREPIRLPEGSLGLFRSKRSQVTRSDVASARHQAEFGVELILGLIEKSHINFVNKLRPTQGLDPEEAAGYARSMMRLPPDTPIPNMVRGLERLGVIVIAMSGLSDKILGFSAWLDSPEPRAIIAYNRDMTAYRLRFTLAHELGHLIYGHELFTPNAESELEANLFAGALDDGNESHFVKKSLQFLYV